MTAPNTVTIEFATGGYVVRTVVDGEHRVEVHQSTAKLLKSLRGTVDSLTLVPSRKGTDDADE